MTGLYGKIDRMSTNRLLVAIILASLYALTANPARAETKVLRVVPHADLTQLDPVYASIVITREYGLTRSCSPGIRSCNPSRRWWRAGALRRTV
jgi:hypothetical protein